MPSLPDVSSSVQAPTAASFPRLCNVDQHGAVFIPERVGTLPCGDFPVKHSKDRDRRQDCCTGRAEEVAGRRHFPLDSMSSARIISRLILTSGSVLKALAFAGKRGNVQDAIEQSRDRRYA